MKRFKQLLTEITMINTSVMFLLEARGSFKLNINTQGQRTRLTRYLPMSIDSVAEFEKNKIHTLETPLTLRYHSSHKKSGEDFSIHKLVLDEKNNISVVNDAGEQVPLNKIEKPTGGENEGHLHELRLSRVLKHYGIARRDSRVGGSGDGVDISGSQSQHTETPTDERHHSPWGEFSTSHVQSGNPENLYTIKKQYGFEVKKSTSSVVLSQLTLNHVNGKWVIPKTTDPKMEVTARLLKDIRFAHKHYPDVSLLDTINSGVSNPGTINTGGIYGSNESHIKSYATPQRNADGTQKRSKTGKPLFQEIPQHDSLSSTDLSEAQEHLAKKSDFLIVGRHLYTLNSEVHGELRNRGIPSIMLSHPENENEGTIRLHTRVKNPSSGNVNVSMRFNDDLHDGVPINHDHLVLLSNGYFNNDKKTYENKFDNIINSPA